MSMPTRRFANDDDAAQHWLSLLRDGDAEQKIQAREQLAMVFERRGLLEEATELLISNLHDGVRNADIFRWLARLYRNQGKEVLAMQAAAEAAKYLVSATPTPAVQPSAIIPQQPWSAPHQSAPAVAMPSPGQCTVCGYINRSPRALCKECRSPLAVQVREARSPLNLVLALLVAIPTSWLASTILAMLIMIFPGVMTASQPPTWLPWIIFGGWIPIAIYWVYGARSVRHVARKALMTLAVESFAMPAVGLISGVGMGASGAGADRSGAAALGALAAGGMMAVALGCVGVTFGVLFLVVWLAIRKDPADA